MHIRGAGFSLPVSQVFASIRRSEGAQKGLFDAEGQTLGWAFPRVMLLAAGCDTALFGPEFRQGKRPLTRKALRVGIRSVDYPLRLIVSEAFAASAGEARERLVSLGRYALRGVRRPEELFTLDLER